MSSFVSRKNMRIPIKDEADLDHVARGSLLEIVRDGYTHWAVYIGNRKVCHFTVEVANGPSFTASMACLTCKEGIVVVQLFREMLGGEKVSVFANNSSDSKWKPKSPSEIVTAALKQNGVRMRYNLVEFNCEHFANKCRYGIETSFQVEDMATAVSAGAVLAGIGVMALAFGKVVLGMK